MWFSLAVDQDMPSDVPSRDALHPDDPDALLLSAAWRQLLTAPPPAR